MGNILIPPPNILKWLADTILDHHRQLSPLAPDRTTESDRCEERAISTNSILFRQTSQRKRINRQRANTDVPIRWHSERVFVIAVVMVICSRDSKDPRGYRRMDRLGTLETSGFRMYLTRAEIQLMCRIPTWE